MEEVTIENVSNGADYYAVTFNLIYDPTYHFLKILNAGWQDKNGKKILGDKGGEISNPWPLDVNGDPIRGGVAARQAGALYLGFGVKVAQDFSVLGLPETF